MLEAALEGLLGILHWKAFLMMMIGIVVSSTLVAMPGIGSKTAIAMMLPFAFVLNQYEAVALIVSIWAVSNTANSITSILFSVPGGAGSQATIMDGYPMAQNGEAARALGAAFTASAIGGVIRPLVLIFGPPEFFMLVMLGVAMVGALSGKNIVKGVAAGAIGFAISMIGIQGQTGFPRFTFDQIYLFDGIGLIPMTIGLFAIPELIFLASQKSTVSKVPLYNLKEGRAQGVRDCWDNKWLIVRSSFIGVWVGVIPGLGSAVADWFAYGSALQTCKGARETFGKGDVRGVIAVDAATNAKEGGSLIPTLAFGIPGSSTLALIFGGLVMVGITPGREILTTRLDITFSIIWLLIIASVLTSVVCLLFTRQLAMATRVRSSILVPIILGMAAVGSFANSNLTEDLVVMAVFGVIGYFMRASDWPRPPLLLGMVLGPLAENFLWTSYQIFGFEFLLRPGVITLGTVMTLIIAYPIYQKKKAEKIQRIIKSNGKSS
jgi:putative tricarboxylic transport membrane protein